MNHYHLMWHFVCQFGEPGYHGIGYLLKILQKYEAHGFSRDTADYKLLLSEIASEKGIQPDSIKRSIQRYVKQGWKIEETHKRWQYYTGWKESTPPNADTAIRLICESFDNFAKANLED